MQHAAPTHPSHPIAPWLQGGPKKLEKCHKIGPRGLKIDYNGIIRTVFDPKITFPTCVRVKNVTFDRFLKIFKKIKQIGNMSKILSFKIVKKSC